MDILCCSAVSTYNTHESRTNRCSDINLCSLCTSTKHMKDACPRKLDFLCVICQSKEHVSAMCPKYRPPKLTTSYCINASSNCSNIYLLPTLTINRSRGNRTTAVRCLVDTGSQRSYISADAACRIGLSCDKLANTNIEVSTFVDSCMRNFNEASIAIDLGSSLGKINVPLLIDNKFDLKFDIDGLTEAILNIKRKYLLADTYYDSFTDETVILEGLIGSDIIQYFERCFLVKCFNGSAFNCGDKLIPFGNIDFE